MSDWATSKVRHGTQSGAELHRKLDEVPCDACYRAKSEYDARRREAPERARKSRFAARAQGRAYRRLAHLYPDLYQQFYAEEKQRLSEDQP